MKVALYRNLHIKCWSLMADAKVIAHRGACNTRGRVVTAAKKVYFRRDGRVLAKGVTYED